ncbi:MAG: hypothetical protein JWM68_1882 [Verrucomicrobiales bacterium]|nr:hypothetical protein [Verrucomicrobiales bacterium]
MSSPSKTPSRIALLNEMEIRTPNAELHDQLIDAGIVRPHDMLYPPRAYWLENLPAYKGKAHIYKAIQIVRWGVLQRRYHYCRYTPETGDIVPVGACGGNCYGHTSHRLAREHFRDYLIARNMTKHANRHAGPCVRCGVPAQHEFRISFDPLEWNVPVCRDHAVTSVVENNFHLEKGTTGHNWILL